MRPCSVVTTNESRDLVKGNAAASSTSAVKATDRRRIVRGTSTRAASRSLSFERPSRLCPGDKFIGAGDARFLVSLFLFPLFGAAADGARSWSVVSRRVPAGVVLSFFAMGRRECFECCCLSCRRVTDFSFVSQSSGLWCRGPTLRVLRRGTRQESHGGGAARAGRVWGPQRTQQTTPRNSSSLSQSAIDAVDDHVSLGYCT